MRLMQRSFLRGWLFILLLILVPTLIFTWYSSQVHETNFIKYIPSLSDIFGSRNFCTKTAVVLVTYMRGGSTFLGEVFNQNDDAFYWFEPLPGVFDHFYSRDNLDCRSMFCQVLNPNGSIKIIPQKEIKALTGPLKAIFQCNMAAVPVDIYNHPFMTSDKLGSRNRRMSSFNKCRKVSNSLTACIPKLTEICHNSTVVSSKVIRLRIDLVKHIIEGLPPNIKVKVIHLLRDPRGILVSRGRYKLTSNSSDMSPEHNKEDISKNLKFASTLCRTMLVNIDMEKALRKVYPNTFMQITYEYLATMPKEALKDIYAFAGLNLTKKTEDKFLSLTHANQSNDKLGTMRKNSTQTAFRWQTKMFADMQGLVAADKYCKELIQHLQQNTALI